MTISLNHEEQFNFAQKPLSLVWTMHNVCDEDKNLITFQCISLLAIFNSSAAMAQRKRKSEVLLRKEGRKCM